MPKSYNRVGYINYNIKRVMRKLKLSLKKEIISGFEAKNVKGGNNPRKTLFGCPAKYTDDCPSGPKCTLEC